MTLKLNIARKFYRAVSFICVLVLVHATNITAQPSAPKTTEWGLLEPVVQVPPRQEIRSVMFSTNGKSVATVRGEADKGGTLQLWDAQSGGLLWTATPLATKALAFSPDDKTLAGTSSTNGGVVTLTLWDAHTGQLKQTLPRSMHRVGAVAFSPDGKHIASGGTGLSDNGIYMIGGGVIYPGEVNLWESGTGRLLHTLKGHQTAVVDVAFSPDGKVVGSASRDRTVRLWDAETGKLQRTLSFGAKAAGVSSVAFSPDGKTLATGSAIIGGDGKSKGEIRLWNLAAGKLQRTLHDPGSAVLITEDPSLAFSPDGRTLASTGSGEHIILWDMPTGTQRYSLGPGWPQHPWRNTIKFVPEGLKLASYTEDGRLQISLWPMKK